MYLEALASGGGSDWFYTVILKAPLGSAITLDDNDEEVNAVGTGDYIGIPVHNASSTYAITVEANGFQRTGSVTSGATSGGMSSLLDYSFGEIDLTIDPDFNGVNATVTDGTSTATVALPATGTSAVIFVPNTGNWTISATDPVSGNTFNSSPNPVPVLAIGTPVSAGLYVIPDGSTVTPTDDIATWLLCADIKNVSYTTLEEVLADEEVLRKLLTSDNANNYLVRSKTWSVNPKLVPTMLGPTVPSGEASGIRYASYVDNDAWKVFDGDPSTTSGTIYLNNYSGGGGYLQYEFPNPVVARKCYIRSAYYTGVSPTYGVVGIIISGSNDGNTFTQIGTGTRTDNSDPEYSFTFENDTAYRYYRVEFPDNVSAGNYTGLSELQFYGLAESIPENELAMKIIGQDDYAANTLLGDSDWRDAIINSDYWESVLNASVPTMTSNTEPSGEASGDSYFAQSSYDAYKAFNENYGSTDFWMSNGSTSSGSTAEHWLQYEFDSLVKVVKAYVDHSTHGWGNDYITSIAIKGSNDNFVSEDVTLATITPDTSTHKDTLTFANASTYKYYRLETTGYNGYAAATNNKYVVTIDKLQFYGRQAGGVQTLLKAAGITNKPYLTIEEVLADHEAVQKIMHSHDAVDYLVTAKLFIDAFTSDAFAMRCIGLRNYAADTLLADSEWLDAIGNSDYVEYVLNAETPAMTSDNTPSGTCIKSTSAGAGYEAYRAFDDNSSTLWISASISSVTNEWIGYEFDSNVKVYRAKGYTSNYSNATGAITSFEIQQEVDSNWETLASYSNSNSSFNFDLPFNNANACTKYRLHCLGIYSGRYQLGLYSLKFYGRKDVDETKLQVFSAANDSFSLQDPSTGSLSPIDTTDSTGHVEIAKTAIPTGQQTLYSGVAKNPNKLTDDYFKRVNVDDWTSIIELMPDDALYWYGYESPNLEDCTTANGWRAVSSSYSFVNPTHNTQDILLYAGNSQWCGIGEKNIKSDNIRNNMLTQGVTMGSSKYGFIQRLLAKDFSQYYSSSVVYVTQAGDTLYSIPSVGDYKSFAPQTDTSRSFKIKSFWNNRASQTPTFLSAANDVLYILDGSRQIPIAITNAEGKSYDPMLAPGTYTIYSSVAKDPNNLSNPYSKTVTITADTVTVPIMPNNTLYWYGFMSDDAEDMINANGWNRPGCTFTAPTYDTNNITLTSGSSNYMGIGSKNPVNVDHVNHLYVIGKGVTAVDGTYSHFGCNATKTLDTPSALTKVDTITSTTLSKFTSDFSAVTGERYLFVYAVSGRSSEVHAMLYD